MLYYRNDDLHGLWKRNFDIGVAHAEHPEMLENTKPGKEGMRLVRVTSALLKTESYGGILGRSGWHAVRFGIWPISLEEHYERIYRRDVVRKCSANKAYWEKE